MDVLENRKWITNNKEKISSYDYFDAIYHLSRYLTRNYDLGNTKFKKNPLITNELLKEMKEVEKISEIFKNIQYQHFIYKISFGFLEKYPNSILKLSLKDERAFYKYFNTYKSKILSQFRINPIPNFELHYIFNAIERVMNNGIEVSYEEIAKELNYPIYYYDDKKQAKHLIEPILKPRNDDFYRNVNDIAKKIAIINEIVVRVENNQLMYGKYYKYWENEDFFREFLLNKLQDKLMKWDEGWEIQREIHEFIKDSRKDSLILKVIRRIEIRHPVYFYHSIREPKNLKLIIPLLKKWRNIEDIEKELEFKIIIKLVSKF